VPDPKSPNAQFAVFVSVSHTLFDGHGFYKMHNMLTGPGSNVKALSPTRKQEIPEKVAITFPEIHCTRVLFSNALPLPSAPVY
jgi:hypothetical protein